MTPKEKAEDLFSKFIDEIPPNQEKDINKFMEVDREAAKQCALIAVDEILNVIIGSYDYELEKIYWQEVKKEIEAL
jgi:ferritin-like protein